MEPMDLKWVQLYDEYTETTLGRQVTDPASKYAGGIMDSSRIPRPTHVGTPSVLACWACVLVHPESRFHHNGELLAALERGADFMLNRQHLDGTVSLGSTNFNSPPDTAFVVGGVTQMVQLLSRDNWPELQTVTAKLKLFLQRTIPAMLTGGCHTPNHRWVLTGALCLLYEIFPLPELLARAEDWLAEGLDITEDGEWTERSNGIYNAVSNIALYHTGRVLNRPELLESVRRNLKMMVYLVHPSGEVVTDYSGRQDFGQTYSLASYFLSYRFMAALDRDPLFAAMSDYAGSFIQRPEAVNNNALLQLLVYDRETDISGLSREPLPDRYVKVINGTHPVREHLGRIEDVGHHMRIQHSSMHLAFGSPVVRIREGETSATIMARTPSFFSLRHGGVRLLGVKLSSSFSPGAVLFEELTLEGGGYRLDTTLEKGYSGPLPAERLPAGAEAGADSGGCSPWYLLPHQDRPVTHLQTHRLTAELTPEVGGWRLRVHSDDREDVITQLTFILGSEGTLEGTDLEPYTEGRYWLKSGYARCEVDGDGIEIGPGAEGHGVPEVREDAHPHGCRYVHVNLVTPFDRTFTVRMYKAADRDVGE